jgi:hypothetical protein
MPPRHEARPSEAPQGPRREAHPSDAPQRAAAAEGVEYTAGGLALLPPYVPLRRLGRGAAGLLAATGALAAIALGVELSRLRLLLRPVAGEAALQLARTAHEVTGGALDALRLALFVATATAFLLWAYQARANVRALGVRRPRFARPWAVLAFLVPGLNLVRPYAVLAEIWQGSDPAILDPLGWRGSRVPRLLRLWWGTVLGWAALLGLAAFADATAGAVLGRLRLAAAISALADCAACAAAGLGWLVVTRLGEAQQAKWERARAAGAAAAPR